MEIYIIKQVVKFGNVNPKHTLSTFDVKGVYLTREGAERQDTYILTSMPVQK